MEDQIIEKLLVSHNAIELVALLVFLVVIGVLRHKLIEVFQKAFNEALNNLKFGSEKKLIKSLQYHDIFRTIERVRKTCNKTRFYAGKELDSTKSQMFSDFMDFKLDSIRHNFKLLIDEAPNATDNDHLKEMCYDAVADSIKEYIERTRVHFIKKGISYKDADYVVDLFERWRLETITSVQNRINSVYSSKFHRTKYENLLAVLELISMAIDLIPKDGIAAFNSFNGKFKNIKYNSERNN